MTLYAPDRYDTDDVEHECPTPLAWPAEDFGTGGQFFSPAGRWERIASVSYPSPVRLVVNTDRTAPGYGWQFWPSDKFPYIPADLTDSPRPVLVSEFGTHILAGFTTGGLHGCGHTLVHAIQVRGTGWIVSDRPDGITLETVTVASKARARAEVTRRARAHAKRLGLRVEVTR